MEKTTWGFLLQKYSKFWSVPLEHYILLSANLLFMKSNVGKIKTGEGGGGNGRNNGCVF